MAWSPDGSKLAYTDYQANGAIGLFVLDLASGGMMDVSGGLVNADQPAWSPDGTEVAFTGVDAETGYEIYLVGSDGSALRRITDEPDDGVSGAHMPTWSPEGTRIAYAVDRYDDRTATEDHSIIVRDLGGARETIVAESPAPLDEPAWSPDGTKLAFLLKGNDVTQVHVANAHGSGEYNVVHGMDVSAQPSAPSWSPDGSQLIFGSVDPQTSNLGITVVDLDGSGARTLLEDAYLATPIWAPAGDLIAFLRNDAGRPLPAVSLWVMRPDGSDPIQLADGLDQVSEIAWQPLVATAPAPSPMVPDGSISTDGSALPEGKMLVQVDDQVEILEEGAETSTLVGRDLFALDLSPDGSRVLVSTPWDSVGPETALVSVDLSTGERMTIAEPEGWSLPARWSPDGSMVAYRLGEQITLCIRELVIDELRCLPEIGAVYEFDWSPDSRRLVLDQPPPGSLTVLDVETEQTSVVASWDDPEVLDAVGAAGLGEPVAIQFQGPLWSPSGRYLAALAMVRTQQGHSGNVVLVFDLSGDAIARGVPFGEFSEARGWSPAADVFAYASGEPPYRIVDARLLDAGSREDRLLISADGDRTIQSLAWSPSGRWIAVVLVAPDGQGWFVSEIQILDTTGVDPPRTFRSQGLPQLVDWGLRQYP
jgi:Tol biopolymer transport system component